MRKRSSVIAEPKRRKLLFSSSNEIFIAITNTSRKLTTRVGNVSRSEELLLFERSPALLFIVVMQGTSISAKFTNNSTNTSE